MANNVNAIMVRGDRSTFERVVDLEMCGREYRHLVPPAFDMNETARDPSVLVVPVELYEHFGELPNNLHVYGYRRVGLTPFVVDQYFRGPEKETLPSWSKAIGRADRELHQYMIQHCGVESWPGKPDLPPYLKLFDELRFVTEACETRQRPYMFLYHRRTQGVRVKRIM